MSSPTGRTTSAWPSELGCAPRFFTPRNPDRLTLGPKIARVGGVLGTPFMPWQQYVADVAGEIDPATGMFWYREIVIVIPRQSGKTTWTLAKAVHRARAIAALTGLPQNIRYAAQTRNDAREKWEDDHVAALDRSPLGKRRPRLYKVRKVNGREAILWNNGSKHGISSVTEKSGHGPTLDEAYIDEAFAHQDFRLEQAFKPTMITRPGPQVIVLSTAGKSPDRSPYLWAKVEAGRERCLLGEPSRVAYFEWSAAEDMDPAEEPTWWATMPALSFTQSIEAVRGEFESMPRDEFCRAYLNMWLPPKADTVVTEEMWEPLGVSTRLLDPVTLAVDVAPDSSWASIVAVGDHRGDVSQAAAELIVRRPGTGWCVEELVRLRDEHHPRAIWVDPKGPAAGLLPDMYERDLDPQLMTPTLMAQAAATVLDDIRNGRLVHRNQPELDSAAYAAARRKLADGFAWTRSGSNDDICAFVALTVANHGHRQPVDVDEGEDFAEVI